MKRSHQYIQHNPSLDSVGELVDATNAVDLLLKAIYDGDSQKAKIILGREEFTFFEDNALYKKAVTTPIFALFYLGIAFDPPANPALLPLRIPSSQRKFLLHVIEEMANSGNANALYNLSRCYCLPAVRESLVTITSETIETLLLQAANQGHARAMQSLSYLYERGFEVKQNEKKSSYWKERTPRYQLAQPAAAPPAIGPFTAHLNNAALQKHTLVVPTTEVSSDNESQEPLRISRKIDSSRNVLGNPPL